MKKILSLIIAILSVLSIQAQKKSLADYPEVQLGKCADGKPFMCHFVSTDGEVKKLQLFSDVPLLLVGDKNGNKLFNTETLEEIAEPTLKNQRLIYANMAGYMTYSLGKMFSFRYGQPTFFNLKGEKVWTTKDELVLLSKTKQVTICSGNRKGDLFTAYETTTGKPLWHKTITGNIHYPWTNIFDDNSDNIIYIMGDSLIRLNVVTGDTLRHAFTAGIKEPLKSRLTFAKPRYTLPSSDFVNEAIFSVDMSAILTGTHSNIIFSGDSLFVADAEHLYCLDKNLKTRWTTDLPAQCGSKSSLKIYGDKIYMQNYGIAFQNQLVGRCGRPFTAIYDRNTGKQLSLAMIDIKKKVIGGIIVRGRTYWQTDNQFFYNEEGDSTVHEIKWKPNTTHSPQEDYPNFMICDTVKIVKNGIPENVMTNNNQLLVEVYGQDVNMIKADGSCELLPADSVYFHDIRDVYSTNNKDQANTFIIIDPKTQKIKYTIHLKGKVSQDKFGNIYVATQQGVGFHQKE